MVIQLLTFGKSCTMHQAVDRIQKCRGRRQELETDEIAVWFGTAAHMSNARLGGRRLTVEHEAHRLNRLNRKRLTSLDQGAVMGEVVDTSGFSGIERSPKRTEHLVSNMGSSIAWRTHHTRPSIVCLGPLQASRHSGVALYEGITGPDVGRRDAIVRHWADYGLAIE